MDTQARARSARLLRRHIISQRRNKSRAMQSPLPSSPTMQSCTLRHGTSNGRAYMNGVSGPHICDMSSNGGINAKLYAKQARLLRRNILNQKRRRPNGHHTKPGDILGTTTELCTSTPTVAENPQPSSINANINKKAQSKNPGTLNGVLNRKRKRTETEWIASTRIGVTSRGNYAEFKGITNERREDSTNSQGFNELLNRQHKTKKARQHRRTVLAQNKQRRGTNAPKKHQLSHQSSRRSTHRGSNLSLANMGSLLREHQASASSVEVDNQECHMAASGLNLARRNTPNQRKYTEGWNFGGPSLLCPNCKALMWAEEEVAKQKNNEIPSFNLCCQSGKVILPPVPEPPPFLKQLLSYDGGPRSNKFREMIRSYNTIFAFTSMGGKVDTKINRGGGPYVFRINGQNHHKIGSLLPPEGEQPRFTQLYIYDTENEVQNRVASLTSRGKTRVVDPSIVRGIAEVLYQHNQLAKVFRSARERFREDEMRPVRIRLLGNRNIDGRQFNLPTESEVAALIVDPGQAGKGPRDIIIEHKARGLQRISELHPKFMSLQYPRLFPYGEDGYKTGILHADAETTQRKKQNTVSMREYYAYQLQQRPSEGQTLLLGERLRLQFATDAYTCIQEVRLQYIRSNQKTIRKEVFRGLTDAIAQGNNDGSSIGQHVVLPASFYGGPRFMMQNFQDAIAICGWAGPPDLFITFTCNPKWPEITSFLAEIPGQRPEHRPDIISRAFKIKLDELMQDLSTRQHFGKMKAVIYTIEFQKRGLPHAHILLFLHPQDKPLTPDDVDNIISAELPDVESNPIDYESVVQYMVHGPCGVLNFESPCMEDGLCTKRYPKEFRDNTTVDDAGFPLYRRRNQGRTALKTDITIDNRFVVPHNIDLVVKYQAHINVELCNKTRCVKYLFKYVNKGPDMAHARVEEIAQGANSSATTQPQKNPNYEIETYLRCRYVSAIEACWRIFGFELQYKYPPVKRLGFHLENHQDIYYGDDENLEQVVEREQDKRTTFLGWMEANSLYEDARELTYAQFPMEWVWLPKEKMWRKRGEDDERFSIGRIYTVHPTAGEPYYLRMLLNVVTGAKCFEDIRTYEEVYYDTYKETCNSRGLLADDNEWHEAMTEAAEWAMGPRLRQLFVTLLLFCEVSNPRKLWEAHWEKMSDDIQLRQNQRLGARSVSLTDEQIQNYTLYEIETLLNKNSRSLIDYADMPQADEQLLQDTETD